MENVDENNDKEKVEADDLSLDEGESSALQPKDDEDKQKKKSDDLWASFLSDVGSRPKSSTTTPDASSTPKVSCVFDMDIKPCLNFDLIVKHSKAKLGFGTVICVFY